MGLLELLSEGKLDGYVYNKTTNQWQYLSEEAFALAFSESLSSVPLLAFKGDRADDDSIKRVPLSKVFLIKKQVNNLIPEESIFESWIQYAPDFSHAIVQKKMYTLNYVQSRLIKYFVDQARKGNYELHQSVATKEAGIDAEFLSRIDKIFSVKSLRELLFRKTKTATYALRGIKKSKII